MDCTEGFNRTATLVRVPTVGLLGKGDDSRTLFDACQEPMSKILRNAGYEPQVTLMRINAIKEQNPEITYVGLDVSSGKFKDLIKGGIIDPTKVTKTALTNAVSVAGTLLTTNCIVYKEQEEKKKI